MDAMQDDIVALVESTSGDGADTAAFAWSAQSRVYHRPRCRWAWRIRAANLRGGTREDAVATGRRECRSCGRERTA